ncbi:MAG TPA: PIG-L family deacetylase [Anaerolineales bacterium]|nr:PIG-L family deacetylase [Anaerolineales bacterium]
MLGFALKQEQDKSLQALCLGAHSDDIEIGCGGTIYRLIKEYPNIKVHWVAFGSTGIRTEEALGSANELLRDVKDKMVTT